MSYAQQWQQLENQLKNIQRMGPFNGYIRDGIANLAKWEQQEIRPLFIGKEAYGASEGPHGGYSITEVGLNEDPVKHCRESPRSWQKTAYIGYALQHGLPTYDATIRHKNKVYESLRTIAFINVGKLGGGTRTDPQRLQQLYAQNRLFLHEQIAICQPNVIIGWNTLGHFENDNDFMERFGKGRSLEKADRYVRYWRADGCLFIAAKHPSYPKIGPAAYVNGILDAVRENVDFLNKKLPSW